MKLNPFTPIEIELRESVEIVCDFNIANFTSFSAVDVTDALRETYGVGVNIAHEAVKPIVHQIMARKPNVEKKESGNLIVYYPVKMKLSFNRSNFMPQSNSFSQLLATEFKSFERVESSWIAGFHYDFFNLFVSFKDGKISKFVDVPAWVITGFKNAESKGRYFNQEIKCRFKSTEA